MNKQFQLYGLQDYNVQKAAPAKKGQRVLFHNPYQAVALCHCRAVTSPQALQCIHGLQDYMFSKRDSGHFLTFTSGYNSVSLQGNDVTTNASTCRCISNPLLTRRHCLQPASFSTLIKAGGLLGICQCLQETTQSQYMLSISFMYLHVCCPLQGFWRCAYMPMRIA